MNRATLRQCITVVASIAAITVGLLGCHHAEVAEPVPRSETPPIVVDDAFRERAIGLDLDILEDPSNALSFADVRSPEHAAQFIPSTKAAPNFGYTKSAYWARFSLDDRRDGTNRASGDALELTLAYAITDLAELWCENAGGAEVVHARAGEHVLLAEWPSTYREPSFQIPPEARACFLRVKSGTSTQFPLTLRTRDAFASHRLSDTTVQCLYFGAILVMIAYNGLVAVSSRSLAYGFYTLFLLSYGLFQCSLGGFGYALLWPNAVGWADRAVPLFIASCGLTSIPFAALLLDLPRTSPRFWTLARVTMALFALHVCVMGFLPYSLATRAVLAIMPLWAVVLLGSGVRQSWRGVRVAKLYLAAWTIFIISTLVYMLRSIGILPTNAFTVNAMQIGSAIEFVLLSFALADRIKTLQAEVATQANLATHHANLAREVTERALAEQERSNAELQRMDRLKDAFLANTSHELRTPLNGILGLVENTLSGAVGGVPSPVKRNLELVRASGRRLASLVNDILDFSKLRENTVALKERPLALAAMVDLTLQTLESLAADKKLRLVSEVEESIAVRADENRLQQVLTNLVGNAIKFTGEGSVSVRAESRGGRIFVHVQDTGIGIALEAQSRIFESFEQADGATAREYGGTGLGLAVTKQLVELHGGKVSVVSTVGAGSTFTFDLAADAMPEEHQGSTRFALAQAPSMMRLAAVDDAVPHYVASQGIRVLVVDDEPINREVLAQHLGAHGFEVIHAQDGNQAIERIERDKPDLVLLDVMMPKKTGYDVLEAIRPTLEAKDLPVILLTAKAQDADLKLGFSLGASDYLLKPVSFVELDARVAHHARLVQAIRALSTELDERRRLQGELDTAAQQLTQAENMATLGMLMAGIAHDLRNPLNYVQGAAEQLREAIPSLRSIDEGVREKSLVRVEKVVGWVEQGTASMDAISLAMRNQARGGGAVLEEMNLRDVVNEALVLCNSRTKLCALTVDVQDATIVADPTGVGQLVMNLVSNAADALKEAQEKAPRDSHEIRVVGAVAEGQVILEVHDSGPGIPEPLRAKILEPFFTTKPRGQGTGLGLAIVQRVVKQHGGSLQIARSEALGGASFLVRWGNET